MLDDTDEVLLTPGEALKVAENEYRKHMEPLRAKYKSIIDLYTSEEHRKIAKIYETVFGKEQAQLIFERNV